ncbi:MAG: hypothetical protein HLX50_22425 [Alteromonadaceae bacterium]|nr:hypothetical protein [Alteromonadaceae bacterium]
MKRGALPAVLALLTMAMPARAEPDFRLHIETEARSTTVAANRLQDWLASAGCRARLSFTRADGQSAQDSLKANQPADLTFRLEATGQDPRLAAVNREGQYPVPVWVTRKTAGVRSLAELDNRDVSLVDSQDPLARRLPLQALAAHGVRPTAGQLYLTGDFSSALGLLLHNNTHAAASELGLVRPMLSSQGLTINWRGAPVRGAGWYGPEMADNRPLAKRCIDALPSLRRDYDRQIFRMFPEWVHRFAAPESIAEKETRP